MKKIHVLQHLPDEPLGTWEEELERWHAPFEYIRLWDGIALPKPEQALAAIILGGTMNVEDAHQHPWMSAEMEYIRALLQRQTPVLGVCLGAQMLAHVLGARVQDGRAPEIGYMTVTLTPEGAEDTLLTGFPMELPVFQWHQQGFDLPAGAVRLAGGSAFPEQAFRHGRSWGLQFHLEVTPALVEQWCRRGAEFINRLPGLSADKIMEQAADQGQMVALYGRQVIRRFWESLVEF